MRGAGAVLPLLVSLLPLAGCGGGSGVRTEHVTFDATIDGQTYVLEAMLYHPRDGKPRHPLIVLTHGRNGKSPPPNPDEVEQYQALSQALAGTGALVMMLVRRGYGNSQGPDSEYLETPEASGLAGAQDVRSAVEHMRQQPEVDPTRIVLMGHSQGGWVTLAAATLSMDGVLGAVNISGGINFQQEGTDVRAAVAESYLYRCARAYGGSVKVPTLWLYAQNDNHRPDSVRAWFYGFQQAGGTGTVTIKPPYGSNGHSMDSQPELFMGDLLAFFESIGFRDAGGEQ